ncbi:MAG: transposase [Bacteroidales bacterium]|nr:transposase [Bacteroidales bacterium]
MNTSNFFSQPQNLFQKQYDALRMYYFEKKSAKEIAEKFGYTYRGFTTLAYNFSKKLKEQNSDNMFFKEFKRGKKPSENTVQAKELIIKMRKKYYSVEDIKVVLDAKNMNMSSKTIYNIISSEGFARLPRRSNSVKKQVEEIKIKPPKSEMLNFQPETFTSSSAGILSLLPDIKKYGIDSLIENSDYPKTSQIGKLNSILCFVALKALNVRRYTADNMWCMDRGSGLFAGLNVLPKAAWFTSYSHRVTRSMNINFLKSLHNNWISNGLLSDTINLDFTTIPYWGDNEHLENNWSGKRTKALPSMLAVLAQDSDSGIIDYGDTNVMHENESKVILEFLDFYRSGSDKGKDLKYLIFDSKFTNYENLRKLEDNNVKFITIRRKGKNITNRLNSLPEKNWKTFRIERAGNKKATIKVFEETVFLKTYDKQIRQINIKGHGKIKPATIILNDFDIKAEEVVRKYARRWIIEKEISEQIEFFHLNNVSSSMVIKVDFDLTMSILTHNIFRLFAKDTQRYKHLSDNSIYEKFLKNSAEIKIDNEIEIKLKKKKNLPLLLEKNKKLEDQKYLWLDNRKLKFRGNTYS